MPKPCDKKKLENDPDYIALSRYGYSLRRLMQRYPSGCPKHIIAAAMEMTEEEIDCMYAGIVAKLQNNIAQGH